MIATVLVNSCDKYKDCWWPMSYSLSKYWHDCPFPISFITNYLDAPLGNTLKVYERINWTDAVRYALKQVKTEYVIWFLEDYWLTDYIDTARIHRYLDIMRICEIDHIRLISSEDVKSDFFVKDVELSVFKDDAHYRCSLNAGIWRTSTLLSLLKDEEFIWDFETQASIRSRGNDKFLCVKYKFNNLPYIVPDNPDGLWTHHAVDRGKWTESAKLYAEKENIHIDFSKNPREDLQ